MQVTKTEREIIEARNIVFFKDEAAARQFQFLETLCEIVNIHVKEFYLPDLTPGNFSLIGHQSLPTWIAKLILFEKGSAKGHDRTFIRPDVEKFCHANHGALLFDEEGVATPLVFFRAKKERAAYA
jgi:hypothetical protein